MRKKSAGRFVVVLVTCGTRREGERIARAVVEAKLAACVNVLQAPVVSFYRWKGKMERGREFLLVMKTSARRMDALRAEVGRLHSYDVPEFLALPVVGGAPEYLTWLGECLGAGTGR